MGTEANTAKNGCDGRALGHSVNLSQVGGRQFLPPAQDDQALPWLTTQTGSECPQRPGPSWRPALGYERESCGDTKDNKGVWRGHTCVRPCACARPSYSDVGQKEQGPRWSRVSCHACGSWAGGLSETLQLPKPRVLGWTTGARTRFTHRGWLRGPREAHAESPARSRHQTSVPTSLAPRERALCPAPRAPPTGTKDGGRESGEKGLFHTEKMAPRHLPRGHGGSAGGSEGFAGESFWVVGPFQHILPNFAPAQLLADLGAHEPGGPGRVHRPVSCSQAAMGKRDCPVLPVGHPLLPYRSAGPRGQAVDVAPLNSCTLQPSAGRPDAWTQRSH